MGGNTGNIRTPRLSATGGSRTYASMIANTNSAVTFCGGTKRILCFYNGVNDFYTRGLGLKYGQDQRYNYLLTR